MFDSLRFGSIKFYIFSTLTFASIVLLVILLSNVSLQSRNGDVHSIPTRGVDYTQIHKPFTNGNRHNESVNTDILKNSGLAKEFKGSMGKFLARNQCKVQFFMTWIAPVKSFTKREFSALDSVFQTNPDSCLVILSSSMSSLDGQRILDALIERGFRVRAYTPNLHDLFSDTPAESWHHDIKNGIKDPGKIPLAQNLSNLIRLAVLYKYGGVYLDTDFIVLKDFSNLSNTIGAQSVDVNGNWTRLNNAVLVFDKGHPLVYKFIEEFVSTFDGNKWGHNGPYMVSRVVERVAKSGQFNFTVLNPMAFYPVYWTKVGSLFACPNGKLGTRWIEAKIRQLSGSSYGVHLWNSQSKNLKIEKGSIVSRLISNHCVICAKNSISSS